VLGDDEGADGLVERVNGIRVTNPACRILVLVGDVNPSRIRQLQQAGADRLVGRDASTDEFTSVVRDLLNGHAVASDRSPRTPDGAGPRGAELTGAETRVLFLLAAGRSNEDIARLLGISLNTVRTHVQRITGKLGAESRLRAVALARECGALDRAAAGGGS
jgi:DNA-binding NarL/FixJ family response regulator